MTSPAINTDVGEGFGVWLPDDDPLLDVVDAANVACGFHAGDPDILRRTCDACVQRDVAIGAQVSYRDLAGFGRRFIDVPTASLVNDLVYQIGALSGFARIAGARVSYVKAHGALYNAAAHHEGHATAIVEAVRLVDPNLPLLCQPNTVVWRLAEAEGLTPRAEAFLDRGYTDRATLVPRGAEGALITDPAVAARRAVEMVQTGRTRSVTGEWITVAPPNEDLAALCVHSDTPGAVALTTAVRKALKDQGIVCSRTAVSGQVS